MVVIKIEGDKRGYKTPDNKALEIQNSTLVREIIMLIYLRYCRSNSRAVVRMKSMQMWRWGGGFGPFYFLQDPDK